MKTVSSVTWAFNGSNDCCSRDQLKRSNPKHVRGARVAKMSIDALRAFSKRHSGLTRIVPIQKLQIFVIATIVAVGAALIVTLIRISLITISPWSVLEEDAVLHRDIHEHVLSDGSHEDRMIFSTSGMYHGGDLVGSKHSYGTDSQPRSVPGTTRMVLVMDFWERMINMQGAIKRLVQVGVDSGFAVVEPFVFESQVSRKYSFPDHFIRDNLKPQPASMYFSTDDLFATNRYLSYSTFAKRARLPSSFSVSKENLTGESVASKNANAMPNEHYLVTAAVYFDWDEEVRGVPFKTDECYFSWCDERLSESKFPAGPLGWRLARDVHVERAVCMIPTVSIVPFNASVFDALFQFVQKGTTRRSSECRECVSLAFINYRKHAFSAYVSHTGSKLYKQKTPPLTIGGYPRHLADKVQSDLLGGRPYVAVQMRTGKAFVLLEKQEQASIQMGSPIARHKLFIDWLNTCIDSVVREARHVAQELGPGTRFYVASDMFNNGWKGGERCPEKVCQALKQGGKRLREALGDAACFHPDEFGVVQDKMGMSSAVDVAVCLQADRFLYATPSNLGKWVDEQRAPRNMVPTIKVNCLDARFTFD